MQNFENFNQQITTELIKRFPAQKVVDLIEDMLRASIPGRGGHPIPDRKTRTEAVKLILTYTVGLPIQRQEIVQYRIDATSELLKRVNGSPILTSALERALESQKRLLAPAETPALNAKNNV